MIEKPLETQDNIDFEILDRLKIPHCILTVDDKNENDGTIKHVGFDKDGNRIEWTAKGVKRPDGLWVETIPRKEQK